MKIFDVYSYGVVSSSTLNRLRGAFPAPEGYAEIDDVRYMTGGEAANSSIVLSRLGARVKLDGNWLGADAAGKRTKALLADYGIDTSRLSLKAGVTTVQEVVFAAQGTRTIFGTYSRLLEEGNWNMPHEEDVVQAKVVCLDPFFNKASFRAAELAFNAHIPVVTVDCRFDDPLLPYTSAVVVAESYLRENYAEFHLEGLFREYQRHANGLVIFTFGDTAIWYGKPNETTKTFQPYSIEPVDTTGAGDSFRAGIVYGYLQGWRDRRMVDFASALAALVCRRFPGVMDAPSYDEIVKFMNTYQT